jgi:hypothetical protein
MISGMPFGMGMMGFSDSIVIDEARPDADKPVTPLPQVNRSAGSYGGTAGFGTFPGFGAYPIRFNSWYAWAMRAHPACVKVFKAITSPILAGTRAIEVIDLGAGPNKCEEIKHAAEAALLPILRRAMPGALESAPFGHWLQEVIWDKVDGRTDPVDVRPILPGESRIYEDYQRNFTGYKIGGQFRLPQYGFLAVHDSHLEPIRGRSPNENALISYFRSIKSAENADAVELKAAGIQVILYIAAGAVPIDPKTGLPMDLITFGREWANAAARGESMIFDKWAFPKDEIARDPKLADVPMVSHEIIDHGDMGPALRAHLDRQDRLDDEIFSAWGVNGRALTEATTHGGFADASAAGDAALNISEAMHAAKCDQWDQQTGKYWKDANYAGVKCRIQTVPAPLSDPQQKYRQSVFLARITATSVDPAIDSNVDWRKLGELTELPLLSPKDAEEKQAEAEQKQQDAADAKAKQMAASNGKPNKANGNNRIAELAGKQ